MRRKFTYRNLYTKPMELFRDDLYERVNARKFFSNKKILDIGCGYGPDTVNISQCAKEVVGVDLESHSSWKKIRQKNIRFIVGSAEKLPFKKDEFEGVFLKDVLHHVDDVAKVLDEIKRVTKRKAKIILIEGNRFNPIFYILATKMNGHEHLTQEKFRSIINNHFEEVKFLHFECYPPFFLNENAYRKFILLERTISKIQFLKGFFSYNAAIITR